MARLRTLFVCQACGAASPRWAGRCDSCGAWNSLVEEGPAPGSLSAPAKSGGRRTRAVELVPLRGATDSALRTQTGIAELDRVTGGGFVRGSALLVGGDPGVGKSTLLLQAAAVLASKGHRVVYMSGEEAVAQVRLRAERLGLLDAPVSVAAETNVETIVGTLETGAPPALLVVDSIQTVWSDAIDAAPGTVGQVRTCAQSLIRYAKRTGAALVLVGHVTKDGQIAGPRVVEHMVDAVLYFEGEPRNHFRILRAVKNRFGPTDEIGVFEMGNAGLAEVPNPSALFLGERDARAPGTAVFAGMEGTRPVLIEIQALVAPSPLGTPRRTVVGWDANRLSMILAVLEARCGLRLGLHDVYLSVAGGLKVTEPAADLAVAAAVVSSLFGAVLPPDTVLFGEVGLSGAVRAVSSRSARLKEAEKLGFARAVAPDAGKADEPAALDVHPVRELRDLIARIESSVPARAQERQAGKTLDRASRSRAEAGLS